MTTRRSDGMVDVIVCGAGPVGLTAAALLAARGVGVEVIERNATTSDEPKAISIDDESLRVYQQAGIIDAILPIVVPGTGTRYYDRHGAPLFQARGPRQFRMGYPFKNPFAQPDLERVLAAAVDSAPTARIRYDTEVTGFEQFSDRVRVRTVRAGVEETLDAAYVLGCDGGRSATRLLQHVEMTGRSYDDVWLVVDTLDDQHTQRYAMHHGDPARPHVVVPGLAGRCRYEFRLFADEGEAGAEPGFDLIRRLLAPYREITPAQVERAVNYRFNAVVADRWMIGRTFLLGDAAHMMPPFAGQGLNSGIRDAANLTWKIAEVLAGRLRPTALATYQQEREPHAWATVRMSERLGRLVMTTSSRLATIRDTRTRTALDSTEGRRFLTEMRYRPVQHYTDGLVVTPTSDLAVGVPIGQPQAFDTQTHRVRRLDEILGSGWAIVGVDVEESAWPQADSLANVLGATSTVLPVDERLPRSSRRVIIDVDGQLLTEFHCYRGRFVLIRPDRFVAAAWPPTDTAHVLEQVCSWTQIAPMQPTDLHSSRESVYSHG